MKSLQQQKQLKKYFTRYKLGNDTLKTDFIQYIIDLTEFIQRKLLMFHLYNNSLSSNHITQYIKLMLGVIIKLNQQSNLSLILKKIIILYTSINLISANNLFTEEIQKFLKGQINQIIKQDIANIFVKKRNSLTKIVGYIKEFSLSKQKNHANYSNNKQKAEIKPDKTAMKEIMSKVIQPFCIYLLKIVQDNNQYMIIKKRFHEQNNEILWKMINWGKSVGLIITAIFKFSRYLKSDLLSTFVLISCLCSKDIGLFYDCLTKHCEIQASEWKIKIQEYKYRIQNSNPFQIDKISNDSMFLDLKGFIQQLSAIKQILLYIFGNKQLKDWSFYFYKPVAAKPKNNKSSENFQFILKFSKKIEKDKKQADSLRKVDKSTDKYAMLCQTEAVYSKELLRNSQTKDMQYQKTKPEVKVDEMQYGTLQMKDITPLPKRNRLNWNNNNHLNEVVIRKNTRLLNQSEKRKN